MSNSFFESSYQTMTEPGATRHPFEEELQIEADDDELSYGSPVNSYATSNNHDLQNIEESRDDGSIGDFQVFVELPDNVHIIDLLNFAGINSYNNHRDSVSSAKKFQHRRLFLRKLGKQLCTEYAMELLDLQQTPDKERIHEIFLESAATSSSHNLRQCLRTGQYFSCDSNFGQ